MRSLQLLHALGRVIHVTRLRQLHDSLNGGSRACPPVCLTALLVKQGGEPHSIWTKNFTQRESSPTVLTSFGRMLSESIHTDITINTSDGSIQAHRAVLSIRSPVFCRMFSHDLKEKELSTLDISDISLEACKALLNYIYGDIQHEDFLTHRLALLYAAEKYDIADLKDACQESLVKFGKVFDIQDDFNSFLQCADKELISEIFHEIICAWKGF